MKQQFLIFFELSAVLDSAESLNLQTLPIHKFLKIFFLWTRKLDVLLWRKKIEGWISRETVPLIIC